MDHCVMTFQPGKQQRMAQSVRQKGGGV
jgi:hypothetical protein